MSSRRFVAVALCLSLGLLGAARAADLAARKHHPHKSIEQTNLYFQMHKTQ